MKALSVLICTTLLLVACDGTPEAQAPAARATAPDLDPVRTAEDVPQDLAGLDIRPEVGGVHGAVVSGHPLASQAGYEVLRRGGNATDAAVTMAAVLAVVRPHMNGVGGDAFSIFYAGDTGEITAMNASGRAGALATPAFFRDQDMTRVPFNGAGSITVPGAVSGWAAALAEHGTLSLAEALQPAIRIADEGFMVSKTLAEDLEKAAERLNAAGQAIFRPAGLPLQAGDILSNPKLAESLRRIASEGPAAMYGGEIGASLARLVEAEGGHLRLSDFQAHHADWVDTVSIDFRGYRIHTLPPNSQGMVLLQMMGMADTLPLSERDGTSADLFHELVEISRIAFADRNQWVADPTFSPAPTERLLSAAYLRDRAALIGPQAGGERTTGIGPLEGIPAVAQGGDTVYLTVVDGNGNAVSWIQSLFGTFGSTLVDGETGIVLQNRGAGFSLEDGHPNEVAPFKRPFHTLMSTLITDEAGRFEMTIGTPGGSGQPQYVTQVLLKTLLYGYSPQRAVEAPRYRLGSGINVQLEPRAGVEVAENLSSRGHEVTVADDWTANFGSVSMIRRLPSGVLRTGADMRREATALAW